MLYSAPGAPEEELVTWIFLVMLGLFAGSYVLEKILPLGLKERLGLAACWTMMAVTMTFLGLSTVGLLYLSYAKYIEPMLAS